MGKLARSSADRNALAYQRVIERHLSGSCLVLSSMKFVSGEIPRFGEMEFKRETECSSKKASKLSSRCDVFGRKRRSEVGCCRLPRSARSTTSLLWLGWSVRAKAVHMQEN